MKGKKIKSSPSLSHSRRFSNKKVKVNIVAINNAIKYQLYSSTLISILLFPRNHIFSSANFDFKPLVLTDRLKRVVIRPLTEDVIKKTTVVKRNDLKL